MDRPSRSLRRLPGRKSDDGIKNRSLDFEYETKKPISPKKSPARKSPARKSPGRKSPSRKLKEYNFNSRRRSRSKSGGRITKPTPNKLEVRKPSPSKSVSSNKKSPTISPPKTSFTERVKESVEKFTKSLSPDIDSYVRRSMSRFEEITNDIRRSNTPATTSSTEVLTRSSLRLRTQATNNLKNAKEVELSQEKIVKNHVSTSQKSIKESSGGRLKILKSVVLVLGMIALTLLTVASHVVCSRDDCRRVLPTLEKFIKFNIYFDGYIWPAFSASLIVLFLLTHFIQLRLKKAPYVSILGIGWAWLMIGSLAVCHFYFSKLRLLKFLPFITASLFHSLVLTAVSANITSLFSVKFSSFIYRISALVSLVAAGWIAAAETSRTVPNVAVFLLTGFQTWNAVDSLVFEPLLNRTTPLYTLLLVVRPFIQALLPIYISANNIKVHFGVLALVALLNVFGYVIYRFSLILKGRHLSDPYSRHKTGYGEFTEGPWETIRHPDLLGRTLRELGVAVSAAPSPEAIGFTLLVLVSNLLEARHLDLDVSSSSRKTRKSMIPFVY